jgi:hypothetical protein
MGLVVGIGPIGVQREARFVQTTDRSFPIFVSTQILAANEDEQRR